MLRRLLLPLLFLLASSPARGDDFHLRTFNDILFRDTNGDGTYDQSSTSADTLLIRQFPGVFQERSLAHFPINSIPANATIESVSITYTALVLTSNSERRVNFLWLPTTAGNLTDATVAGNLMATINLWDEGIGRHTVSMGQGGIDALNQARALGKVALSVRLQAFGNSVNHGVASLEWDVNDAMVLNVTTAAVPEPTTLAAAGVLLLAAAGLYTRRRRRQQAEVILSEEE